MPKTVILTGLTVAKSGTINLRSYIGENIYKLTGFAVISRGAQTHSHAITVASHAGHSHALTATSGGSTSGAAYALFASKHTLYASKATITLSNATSVLSSLTHTASSGAASVAGLARSAKTVIANGLPTNTIPDAGSVALTNQYTITIGNNAADAISETNIVNITYVPLGLYPVP